jgi:hypothetical protein
MGIFGFQATVATSLAVIFFLFTAEGENAPKAAWTGDQRFMPRQEPGEKIA